MVFEILNTSKRLDDKIDYTLLIFTAAAADVLDLDNADDLWIFLQTIIAGGARKIVVNMDGLVFIDSYGIGILINIAKLVRQHKGDIVLLKMPTRILKVVQPLNLQRFIKFFEAEEDVINFFRYI